MTNQSGQRQLTESERFAYLQAMEVPVWVPREPDLQAVRAVDNNLAQNIIQNAGVEQTDPQSAASEATAEALAPTDERETQHASTPVDNELPIQTTVKKTPVAKGRAHFLKMVPWSRGNEQDPAILIICRHQVDQPAQSFARANSPSQFMTDFIQALAELLGDKQGDYHIRLGHLAQAGLGQDCQALEQVVENLQPKLVLLLGDETVKELFDAGDDVARLRGRVLTLANNSAALVTYHPYTLIKNPALKRLALADLQLSASLLLSKQ